jgi:hypothetical protein
MSPKYLGGREVESFLLPSGWLGPSSQTTDISVFFLSSNMLKKLPPYVAVEAYESSCTWPQRKLRPRQTIGNLCRRDFGEVDLDKREEYSLVASVLQLE